MDSLPFQAVVMMLALASCVCIEAEYEMYALSLLQKRADVTIASLRESGRICSHLVEAVEIKSRSADFGMRYCKSLSIDVGICNDVLTNLRGLPWTSEELHEACNVAMRGSARQSSANVFHVLSNFAGRIQMLAYGNSHNLSSRPNEQNRDNENGTQLPAQSLSQTLVDANSSTHTSDVAVAEHGQLGCLKTSSQYQFHPLNMLGQKRSHESSVDACQKRCAGVVGCSHFAWWAHDSGCHLQNSTAMLVRKVWAPRATIGPPDCEVQVMPNSNISHAVAPLALRATQGKGKTMHKKTVEKSQAKTKEGAQKGHRQFKPALVGTGVVKVRDSEKNIRKRKEEFKHSRLQKRGKKKTKKKRL